MNTSHYENSADDRLQAADAAEDGCSDAIRVSADMMDATRALGVHNELSEVRESLLRLHMAIKDARQRAARMRYN